MHAALKETNQLEGAKEDVFYFQAIYYDKFIGKNYKESDLDSQGEIPFNVVRDEEETHTPALSLTHVSRTVPLTFFDKGCEIISPAALERHS